MTADDSHDQQRTQGSYPGWLLSLITGLLLIFGALSLECVFRALFPEFAGDYQSAEKTRGVSIHYSNTVHFGQEVRVAYPGDEPRYGRPILLIVGDSVTLGYGSPYEDIWWVQFVRLLEAGGIDTVEAVAHGSYGHNLTSKEAFQEALHVSERDIRAIIYQFNFNDIKDFSPEAPVRLLRKSSAFRRLAYFRYQYLNRSRFLRVVQHYLGVLIRDTSGSCADRGVDALGPYTWAYGSRPFREESERLWAEFSDSLAELKALADLKETPLIILVSPLLYDIDQDGLHTYAADYNLDFSCATIDPRRRLQILAEELEISLIDPARYLKSHFESRVLEGNFERFFFTAEDNHFTPTAARYVAEAMVSEYVKAVLSSPE